MRLIFIIFSFNVRRPVDSAGFEEVGRRGRSRGLESLSRIEEGQRPTDLPISLLDQIAGGGGVVTVLDIEVKD